MTLPPMARLDWPLGAALRATCDRAPPLAAAPRVQAL